MVNNPVPEIPMAFFFGCLLATWLGRRFGWALSREILYSSRWLACAIICLLWGLGIAYLLRLFIIATGPGMLLKILGYGAGMYISIPNYGLLAENTIPDTALPRHVFIKGVPWVVFMAAPVIFAFAMK